MAGIQHCRETYGSGARLVRTEFDATSPALGGGEQPGADKFDVRPRGADAAGEESGVDRRMLGFQQGSDFAGGEFARTQVARQHAFYWSVDS